MFSKILKNESFIKSLHSGGSDTITKERMKYLPIYTIIENFVRENNFIISRPSLLYESGVNITELDAITIYSENIFRFSGKLINKICEELEKQPDDVETPNLLESNINARWLNLRTVAAHEEINLFYDGRPIVIFKSVQLYKNISIIKLLIPMPSKSGIFTKEPLMLLPPELELMDIYHKLYAPDKAEEWEDLLKTEFHLYDLFIKRKPSMIGGAADCSKSIISNIETIKRLLILEFMRNNPLILIGDWAIKLMEFGETGQPFKENFEKVQILIDSSITDFNELLENFLKNVTQYKCSYREEKLHIVDDGRLRKYTFYIGGICSVTGQRMEKPFLDVFNSCRYEIVPFRLSSEFNLSKSDEYPGDVKIGNAYVLLRFLLLDIWILRVIKNLGLLTSNILENKITRIFASVEKIKNLRKFAGLINKSFQHDNYFGTYQSLMLYQKNKLLDAKFPPYIPYYYKQANGNYRDV